MILEGIDVGGETIGLITYMRTDGVQIANEAITAVPPRDRDRLRRPITSPASPRRYEAKAKNAQEAHEAIRPTDLACRPNETKRFLDLDQAQALRTDLAAYRGKPDGVAPTRAHDGRHHGQCSPGRILDLRATGTVVKFDEFPRCSIRKGQDEGPADEEGAPAAADERTASSPSARSRPTQHFTEPPPRYSEASLVKRMEELGIGRPSTYASILQVLKDRQYVRLDKRRLYPEDRGRIVVAFLESFFAKYVEYDFTAGLEEQLDLISNSEVAWREVLRDFWRDFIGTVDDTKDLKISRGDRHAR